MNGDVNVDEFTDELPARDDANASPSMSSVLLFLILGNAIADPCPAAPSPWTSLCDRAELFVAPVDLPKGTIMPSISNGVVGAVVGGDAIYYAGLRNGNAFEGSYRARIPPLRVTVNKTASAKRHSSGGIAESVSQRPDQFRGQTCARSPWS